MAIFNENHLNPGQISSFHFPLKNNSNDRSTPYGRSLAADKRILTGDPDPTGYRLLNPRHPPRESFK